MTVSSQTNRREGAGKDFLLLDDCRECEAELIWRQKVDGTKERAIRVTFREGEKYMWFIVGGYDAVSFSVELKDLGTQAIREELARYGDVNAEGQLVFQH